MKCGFKILEWVKDVCVQLYFGMGMVYFILFINYVVNEFLFCCSNEDKIWILFDLKYVGKIKFKFCVVLIKLKNIFQIINRICFDIKINYENLFYNFVKCFLFYNVCVQLFVGCLVKDDKFLIDFINF